MGRQHGHGRAKQARAAAAPAPAYIPCCDAVLVDHALHAACWLVVRIADPGLAAVYRGCANPSLAWAMTIQPAPLRGDQHQKQRS